VSAVLLTRRPVVASVAAAPAAPAPEPVAAAEELAAESRLGVVRGTSG
jgi:hypothetical protein